MSGELLTVYRGPGQQFTGANLERGATVWNRDTQNGVWISSDRNVKVGYGLLLPPQSSCNWTGKQLFACVDFGVMLPVILQITNDANNLQDPVGIAEAIALVGVPNVFLCDVLGSLTLPANTSQYFDVHQYASLLLHAQNNVAGQAVSMTILWYADVAATFFLTADNLAYGEQPGNIQVDAWEIPIRGAACRIVNNVESLGATDIVLAGTNRPVNGIKQILTTQEPRSFSTGSIAMTAGVTVEMPATDGLGNYSTLNGPIVLFANGAATGSLTGFYTTRAATASQMIYSVGPALPAVPITINHPNIPIRWRFTPSANFGAAIVNLNIVPAGPT